MGRRRRIFGPLFYGVLALALLTVAGQSLRGLWPAWRQHRELRSLAEDLRSSDPLASRPAAAKLAKAGSSGVPWLIEAARDRDSGARLLAFTALGQTMPLPGASIATLVDGLRDPDPRIRRLAADALSRFGPEAGEATDPLAKALDDDDPEARFRIARVLARLDGRGRASGPLLGVLLAMVADPDPARIPDRTVVVPLIHRMGPSAEAKAVSTFIPLIEAGSPTIRRAAIECLEKFGPPARDAVPALRRALRDDDRVARCLAALALAEIEGWENGSARAMLQSLADAPWLPPPSRKQVNWVLTTDLVAGSEIYQPVHILRSLAEALRRLEAPAGPGAAGPIEDDADSPTP